MNIEKGIKRLGTFIGFFVGIALGGEFWGIAIKEFINGHPVDFFLVFSFIGIGILLFFIGFCAVKLFAKAINWVIKGFRE